MLKFGRQVRLTLLVGSGGSRVGGGGGELWSKNVFLIGCRAFRGCATCTSGCPTCLCMGVAGSSVEDLAYLQENAKLHVVLALPGDQP